MGCTVWLRELQTEFAARITSLPNSDTVINVIGGGVLDSELRVLIYVNNSRIGLRNVLADCYPTIQRLLGPEKFSALSEIYRRRHPLSKGYLQDFAEGFPGFLQTQYELPDRLAILDLARLEWAIKAVSNMPARELGDLSGLRHIAPGRLERLKLSLNPALRTMSSKFPVVDLWHGSAYIPVVPHTQPRTIIVVRRKNRVAVSELGEAMGEFIHALSSGNMLGVAFSQAIRVDLSFNLGDGLVTLYKFGAIATASIAAPCD